MKIKHPLKEGQVYANMVLDYKFTFIAIYMKQTVTVTADIVEFTK